MIRTALRPKWLALLGLVLVVVAAFTWLGLWQLDVSHKKGQRETLEQIESSPEAPLNQVLPPQTAMTGGQAGRKVSVTGHYEAAGQVLVSGRKLGDRVGSWVVTPLVDDATGARLAVVRGFVDTGVPAPAPPSGTVTVHGVTQPQEGPPDEAKPQPSGHMQTVNVSALVNVWPHGPVYNAFVFAQSEEPAARGAAARVTPVPPPPIQVGGIDWRNFFYAVQWWVFAGFVVYLWWRMVRDEYLLEHEPPASEIIDPAPAGGSPA